MARKTRHLLGKKKLLEAKRNKVAAATAARWTTNAEQLSLRPEESGYIGGRRIIAVGSWLDTLNLSSKHGKDCPNPNLTFEKETRTGLRSRLQLVCRSCGWSEWVCSDQQEKDVTLPVNESLVWGINAGGSHFEAAKEMFTVMDVPFITHKLFFKTQERVSQDWNEVLHQEIIENGKAECRAAVEAGDVVTIAGQVYPCTGVFADGGWSTRSYGHSCKSKGGVAVLIGARTKKLLHLGIKNMFCILCKKSENSRSSPPPHTCYKNWSESMSATSMESNIILEGFKSSLKEHGIVYNKLIADGDSSVYSTLQNSAVYPGIKIEKAECVNHVVKNLNKAMINLSKDTTVPLSARKLLKPQLNRFGKSVRAAITYRNQNDNKNHQALRADIMNIPFHTFGQHENCSSYFCKNPAESNQVPEMRKLAIWDKILDITNKVAFMSARLLPNYTSNIAESFMSRLAKHNHGKRINVVQRMGWHSRSVTAALSFTKGKAFYAPIFKSMNGVSPSRKWAKSHISKQLAITRVKRNDLISKKKVSSRQMKPLHDADYGPNSKSPDLDEDAMSLLISGLREKLQVTKEIQEEIFQQTKNQSQSDRWIEERRCRITASNAGEIFSLKDSTPNTILVKKLLFPKSIIHLESIRFGNQNEERAIETYERVTGYKVQKSGLVVSLENGIFAASPDGLIGNDGIIEVKCPAAMEGFSCEDMPTVMNARSYLKRKDKSDSTLELSKTHKYYKQVVMLLHVTGRSWCDFVVYTFKTTKGVRENFTPFIQRIVRDESTKELWERMKAKFTRFFDLDLAPEIVDSRFRRGMEIRQPMYRLTATKEKAAAKKEPLPTNATVTFEGDELEEEDMVPNFVLVDQSN